MKGLLSILALGLVLSRYAEADPLGGTQDMPSAMPVDARCSLSLGGELIDYGTQTRGQLQDSSTASNSVSFGKRTVILSVICPYTQSMRLTIRGQSNAKGYLIFGERGGMAVRILNAQMDGLAVQVAGTTPDGIINGATSDSRLLLPGQTFAPAINGKLVMGKAFTAHVEIEPMMPKADARVSGRKTSETKLMLELMN